MARKTVLELTQDILNTLDSDPVDSIADTLEADQIAKILRKVYYDMQEEYSFPGAKELINLESVSDSSRPNLLRIPQKAQRVLEWTYDKAPVHFISQEAFIHLCNQRNPDDTESFLLVPYSVGVNLTIDRRVNPQYWTSFDDEHIVTDSFNEEEDTTLQASKTLAWVQWEPHFQLTDSFVPVLPDNLEQLYYRTAEGEAYALFKQVVNPKLEQKESRLRIRAQRSKYRSQQEENNTMFRAPNYGRK